MKYNGFAGQTLYVDLTTGRVKKEPLDLDMARELLGGFGIDLKLLYELLAPGTDPLSPANPFIIGAGSLIGTVTPSSSKITFTAKRPVYGGPGEDKHGVMVGTGGSSKFGFMMKNAGYDRIVVTGRAESPVFLKIFNDDIEICDAKELWGKMDAYETTGELLKRYGRCGVYAIGRAGEKVVRIATGTIDGKTSLGKAGGGAVVGSKNLKAIVVYGDKGIRVADSKGLLALYNKSFKDVTGNPGFQDVASYGIPAVGAMAILPGRNWRSFWGKHWQLIDRTRIANLSCTACLTPCQSYMEIKEGRFKGLKLVRRAFPLSSPTRPVPDGHIDYGPGFKVEDAIERLGLDRQNTQQVVQFVSMLYEHGKLSEEDTDGLVLRRRKDFWDLDIDTTLELFERIANKQGDFATLLSEGWYPLCRKLGVDARAEMSISKGVSTILDARKVSLSPALFANITCPGVHHIHFAGYFPGVPIGEIETNLEGMGMSKQEIERTITGETFNIGKVTKHIEDFYAILDSLGICALPAQLHGCFNAKLLSDYYSVVTGFETGPKELKRLGEKVWNLYKLLNVREGFDRKDDIIPSWWKAAEAGSIKDYLGKALSKDGLEKMLDDYYEERGWDIETGIPTEKRIEEVELNGFRGMVVK
jgi:aldehyde:ferredoxin oxidoreductase